MCSPPPWPAFRPEWILYRDDDVLVVHKPVGVSSQRCDVADDLPSRLEAYLRAQGGELPSLGVHQHLDPDTSGLMLYSISPEARRELGRASAAREVDEQYVAVVGDGRVRDGLLEDHLASSRDGKMAVVQPGKKGAQLARTQLRVLERRGDRALVCLRVETGRTHQIRAQLAHRGAAVAGDALYGGAPAPRLMLHATRLELRHPRSGRPLKIEHAPPPEFRRYLDEVDAFPRGEELARVLSRAAERRYALGLSREGAAPTTAFRWVNREADGAPGLVLEIFGDYVVVHLYSEPAAAALDELLGLLEGAGWAGAYVKRHPKKASGLSEAERAALAPAEPAFGVPAPAPLVVYEAGVPFEVTLGGALGVGLFVDQRLSRLRVREAAKGRRMLNLFAHTCSFSSSAALGGASETLSVDASSAALDRGRENFRRAGLELEGHRFLKEDAFVYLGRLARRGERFDLVVVDPPTYSTTRAKRWKSGEGWVDLARACFEICAPDALVLATTNDTRLSVARFRRHLHEGARRASREIAQMKDLAPPRDLPTSVGQEPSPKSVWIRLGG
ncbi:MAG: hypothetical protein GXP55_03525 [Deltaproteobacteria bacterium]|nr:hypothetical protein [Deltaproteobacteria bacterium]